MKGIILSTYEHYRRNCRRLFRIGAKRLCRVFRQDGSKMKLGDPIPAVTVPNQDGKPVNIAEEGKTGYTLVYFYPKAMSKGCTVQACSLRDSYTELQQKG